MTETTTVIEEGNEGDHRYVIAQADVTSLDSSGTEPYDPSTKFNLEGAYANVLDQEDYTHYVFYDEANAQLIVKDVADGTDIADNTDVGTITLRFVGDFAP
jgi:hypothetical protein